MFALAVALATLITLALYVVTSPVGAARTNLVRFREAVRLLGHAIVWGAVLSSFIGLLLPSPWS